jgi:Flp pilus assembly pilin Flp
VEVEPMRKMFIEFWKDDCGAVSPEWMLMATVLVLGSVAALAATKAVLYGNVESLAKVVAGM